MTEYKMVPSQGVPFTFRRWYGHGLNFRLGGMPYRSTLSPTLMSVDVVNICLQASVM